MPLRLLLESMDRAASSKALSSYYVTVERERLRTHGLFPLKRLLRTVRKGRKVRLESYDGLFGDNNIQAQRIFFYG